MPEPQSRFTVSAGVSTGTPAFSADVARAVDGVARGLQRVAHHHVVDARRRARRRARSAARAACAAELEGRDVLERAHVLGHGRARAAQDHDVARLHGLHLDLPARGPAKDGHHSMRLDGASRRDIRSSDTMQCRAATLASSARPRRCPCRPATGDYDNPFAARRPQPAAAARLRTIGVHERRPTRQHGRAPRALRGRRRRARLTRLTICNARAALRHRWRPRPRPSGSGDGAPAQRRTRTATAASRPPTARRSCSSTSRAAPRPIAHRRPRRASRASTGRRSATPSSTARTGEGGREDLFVMDPNGQNNRNLTTTARRARAAAAHRPHAAASPSTSASRPSGKGAHLHLPEPRPSSGHHGRPGHRARCAGTPYIVGSRRRSRLLARRPLARLPAAHRRSATAAWGPGTC